MWNYLEVIFKLNLGGKYLYLYIFVNFEIINEVVKCSNIIYINNVICVW